MALILLVPGVVARADARTVRVGVYENEPKVFTDGAGKPSGIFIDLLTEIAKEERWDLVFVHGTWEQGLAALQAGRIDLMPDVALTEERAQLYDFHTTPVVESWSYVYSAPGVSVERISELKGKRVAVLRGSVQERVFKQMVDGFGLEVTIVPASTLDEAFQMASKRSVDAAVANYLFGEYFYHRYGLTQTPIVFNAVPLFYATTKDRNHDLLEAVDRHLVAWTREPRSFYYSTLSRYTAQEGRTAIPVYVAWILAGVVALLVLSVGLIWLLRWQVGARTRHLVEAGHAVERAEETLRLAVDATCDGIFDWYPAKNVVIWTPRSFTMLGYEPDEFYVDFEKWASFVHPDDRDRVVEEELRGIESDQRRFTVEYRIRKKSGEWMWALSRGKVVAFDDEGDVERVMGTNVDITTRKLAELELQEHRDRLADLVEERTRELEDTNLALDASNQALQSANAELERALGDLTAVNEDLAQATKAKSRFLASMSHELRTPLNSIIGFSGLLSNGQVGPLSEEQAFQIGMVYRSGKQLLELINDILDLSKVEAGKIDVHIRSVDPREVVTEVADTVRPLADEKRIELRLDMPDSPMRIESDADRLRQILINLVGNAVKFTDSGVVSVGFERAGGRVAFIVSDTGIGISAEAIGHVFDAFHQGSTDEATQTKGTGLGLAIAQDFAHLLGGEIEVSSGLGKGSVFTVWLPA